MNKAPPTREKHTLEDRGWITRGRIVLLAVVCVSVGSNARPREAKLGYYYGGAQHWNEAREIGWPCTVCRFNVEFFTYDPDFEFSLTNVKSHLGQPKPYGRYWKASFPAHVEWDDPQGFGEGVFLSNVMISIGWWSAVGVFAYRLTCKKRLQFGIKQLLFLPLLVGSGLMLARLF